MFLLKRVRFFTGCVFENVCPGKSIFRIGVSRQSPFVSYIYRRAGLGLYCCRFLRSARIVDRTSACNTAMHGDRWRQYSASVGTTNRVCLPGDRRIYLASDHADRRAVADTSLWDCRLLAFAAKAAMNRCDAYSARQLDPEQELATFRAGPIGSLKELTKAERSHVTPA
jgi:hypothetical protein